jgi:threonyl-tRNA synthetase
MWLEPVQAVVLPVTSEYDAYAREVAKKLTARELRVEVDTRTEKLGFKIREAQLAKVPFMLVVGQREAEQGGVAPRSRSGKDLGSMPVDQAVELMVKEAAWPVRPTIKEV